MYQGLSQGTMLFQSIVLALQRAGLDASCSLSNEHHDALGDIDSNPPIAKPELESIG
jgi:hypothetical protein